MPNMNYQFRLRSALFTIVSLFTLTGIFFSCTTTEKALADKKNYAEHNDEYRRKFAFTLDSAEKVVRYGYHYVVSTVPG